jgi:acid phosphatase
MFFAALCLVPALSFALLSALFGQSMNPAQSKQEAAGTGKEKEKSENAARSAPSSRHFDRVLVIVLENGDYEAATKDPNLAALAAQGASFSNFHALFHPSYPNYLAMIAGTDFGVSGRMRLLADMQVDFPDDAAHKTIADRLIANGFDFKNYAEELPEGDCPYQVGKQNNANPKTGGYVRRHVPFLSFREVQHKWCDHVVRVDSARDDNSFVRDAMQGLVAYSLYSPNRNNDGHDTSVKFAAEWLRTFLDKKFPGSLTTTPTIGYLHSSWERW